MLELESVMAFEEGIDDFIKPIRLSLLERVNVRLSAHVTPQSLINFSFPDNESSLQLRFVVLAVTRDLSLGRLSWLDKYGRDHVCCYVNDAFQCVVRKQNGRWREQKIPAEELCARCLIGLIA